MTDWRRAVLGRTGREVGRLGLASSYGADQRCVEMAFERGVNYLYWGSFRRGSFGEGLRNLSSRRDAFCLVIQSYSRFPSLLSWSFERALRSLRMDYADVLLLGFWNQGMADRIFERGLKLKQRGLARHLAISTHNRPLAVEFANKRGLDILHVRYNAVHTGAECEVFERLPEARERPGIVSFTATSWGQLMQPAKVPAGDAVPTAGDCYRFVMTNPGVDVCLTGPASVAQLSSALDGWDKGPMTEDELRWMRRVGAAKYRKTSPVSLRS